MDTNYLTTLTTERAERAARVHQNPVNWLSLAALQALPPGRNRLQDPLFFPGTFLLDGDTVTLEPDACAAITVNNAAFTGAPLVSDADGVPDKVAYGALVISVLQRNGLFYLRVWDLESKALREFTDYRYYPPDPAFCVEVSFERFDPPLVQETLDAIGGKHETTFSGRAHFRIGGVACTLIAQDDEDELLFNFTDETRRDTTYPGGRHLSVTKPGGTALTLDFNRALNWPCAYTPFATCPLPPFENRLPVRIEAGEKRYHD